MKSYNYTINKKEGKIKINGNEVPAFINKKANITLVGLKNKDGFEELLTTVEKQAAKPIDSSEKLSDR